MTQEEKAKAYDLALDKAKEWKSGLAGNGNLDNCLDELFPQLVESEDERIRQFLIHEVTETSDEIMSYRNMSKKDVLAWLEKQKPVKWSDNDDIGLLDTLYCVEKASKNAEDENAMGNAWYAEKWLKSLKDRYIPQPKKLDEDTQQWIDCMIAEYERQLETDTDHAATIQAKISVLKSL